MRLRVFLCSCCRQYSSVAAATVRYGTPCETPGISVMDLLALADPSTIVGNIVTSAAINLATWLWKNWKRGWFMLERRFGRTWEEVHQEYKDYRAKIMEMEGDNDTRLGLLSDRREQMRRKYPQYADRFN